jgi:DNA-binding LytR/AlgR family response regulator
LCDESLSELEKKLPLFFFRCNRAFIINLLYVTLYQKEKNSFNIYLSFSTKKVRISIKNKDTFKIRLIEIKSHPDLPDKCIFCKNNHPINKINLS